MTGKGKGASEGKKKPSFAVKTPYVKTPKVASMCKKCGKPYSNGACGCKK